MRRPLSAHPVRVRKEMDAYDILDLIDGFYESEPEHDLRVRHFIYGTDEHRRKDRQGERGDEQRHGILQPELNGDVSAVAPYPVGSVGRGTQTEEDARDAADDGEF